MNKQNSKSIHGQEKLVISIFAKDTSDRGI